MPRCAPGRLAPKAAMIDQTLDAVDDSTGGGPPDDFDLDPSPFDTRAGIAQLCLDKAASRRDLARLRGSGGLAAAVIVPSQSWIEAVQVECRKSANWDQIAQVMTEKGAASMAAHSAHLTDVLSRSGRVLGVP